MATKERVERGSDCIYSDCEVDRSRNKQAPKVAQLPHPPDCRFYRIPTAASLLGLSERQVFRLVEMGLLQAHRFGRCTRISLVAIRQYTSVRRGEGDSHPATVDLDQCFSPAPLPDDCVFLRIGEIASMLQVTPRHVYRLIHVGALGCDHFGRATRISLRSLRSYIVRCIAVHARGQMR
jgi:excisionase family DNA binding protein